MNEWTFQDEIRLRPINIIRAAFLFAREVAYPQLDMGHYGAQVTRLAEQAETAVSTPATIAQKTMALSTFLFTTQELRGNRKQYDDPDNSFLNRVIDRGVGIPISLSVLFVAVARRVGLSAFPIGLPGHFIAGVHTLDGDLYVDPFHGGQRLYQTDCVRLVRQTTGYEGGFQPQWLRPLAETAVLTRMLNNLRLIYLKRETWPEAAAVLHCMHQLQPQVPQHLRDMGLIHYRLGHYHRAAHYLEAYNQLAPDAPDIGAIQRGVFGRLDEWAQNN